MSRLRIGRVRASSAVVGSALVVGCIATSAWAAAATVPKVADVAAGSHSKWVVRDLVKAPVVTIDRRRLKLTSPDDITEMGGHLFAAWQDGVGPQGQPAADGVNFSVVTEYSVSGRLLHTWRLTGKCDGLTAYPAAHRVIATINEDGHSSLDAISPSGRPGHQVVYYHYRPADPLPHGGGTDSVSLVGNQILISASAPGTEKVAATKADQRPALYRARLSRRPGTGTGVAALTSVFTDGSTAAVANTAAPTMSALSPSPPSWCPAKPATCALPAKGARVALDLTDPDSNEVVPSSSPRFGGDLVLTGQGDEQQVYVKAVGRKRQRLSVLYLSQSVDDSAFVTDPGARLYATDQTTDAIVAISGGLERGEVIVTATPSGANNAVDAPNYLATLSLTTGTVTRLPGLRAVQSMGLVLVAPHPA
jgi:hypothetical protein